jgi:GR25 family glycosyltransferase involved in LPS biosynthesis
MSLSTKLAALNSKSVTLEVKEVKLPENSANTLALFESNSSARAATANEWTVDLFPNQVPPVTYLLHLASTASSAADHKDKSKSSLATFCLYYVAVFQAFFLINDMHVRPVPSAHASAWSTVSWKHAFAEWLLNLPVPDSMHTIFAQLYATQTDKTKNVFFVPSAAAFNIHHYFGRYIPVNFFAAIHDCIASMPGNSRPIDIHKDLLPRVLTTLPTGLIPNKTTITVADILGVSAATTTASHVAAKWYQTFSSIFNPVLFRDFHRRSSLATLDLEAPEFTANANLNAYDILFGATPGNLRELKVVLQHVASVLTDTVPCTKTLVQIVAASTGTNATHHGSSTYSLPTWICNSDAENALLESITAFRAKTPTSRASDLKFLKAPAATTTLQTVTAATATSTDNTATIDTLTFPWSLISSTATANSKPADDDFVIFDDQINTYPRVLVLDTLGTLTVSAHLATLTGKIIETFEIDGTTIEMPNVDKSLAMQNCLFADSAVPFRHSLRATKFHNRTTDLPPVKKRSLPRASNSLPASSLLYDRVKVYLPKLPAHTTIGQARIRDAATFTTLPGMTATDPTNWLYYAQSFFGFRTKINTSTTDADLVPATPEGRLYVWSPYTYTPYEDTNPAGLTPDLTVNRSYFLTNLRTIFGTDTNLVEVVHPMEAMPI